MKKTTTTTAKKTTKKMSTPKQPVIEMNITNVTTLDDVVSELIIGKINARVDVSCDELRFVIYMFANFTKSILEASQNMSRIATEMAVCLLNDLLWNNRPWYKKLMFWKKKPSYDKLDVKILQLN